MKEKQYSVFAYRSDYFDRDPYGDRNRESSFEWYENLTRQELIEKLAELKSGKEKYSEIKYLEQASQPEDDSVESPAYWDAYWDNLGDIEAKAEELAKTKILNREEAERITEEERENKQRLEKEAREKRQLEELLKKYPR